MLQVEAKFAKAFEDLFRPKRYKVYYGGRGSGKSWSFARALLLLGMQRPLRVLCAREFQASIAESVHKLLSDQIAALKLDQHYLIEKAAIYGPNGTGFFFEGIAKNTQKIKSYEGIDICWVEEAHNVTQASWDVLIPTIRKEGSEIWISFNPELEGDATYQRFVVNATEDMLVMKVSWRDNPWFPEVLRLEMEKLKAKDYDSYLHVWEGNCKKVLIGAVYAKELRLVHAENRITKVPYERGVSVDTYWDLGRSDMTAIWFVQRVAFQYRFLKYIEECGNSIGYYIKLLDTLPYVYGTHYLPHDAKAKTIGAPLSVEKQLRDGGKRIVKVVPKLSIADGINAVRTLLPSCVFDEKECSVGIQRVGHYKFQMDPDTGHYSSVPVHDENSHGADALRVFGVARRPKKDRNDLEIEEEDDLGPQRPKSRRNRPFVAGNPQGWMR